MNNFSYRVLLVEDDLNLQQVGKALLESQGYEVLVASDGFEGLIGLKKSLPDIIISDLSMPNMSGFEFLSVVRRRFPAIPVIVISGEFTGIDVPESVLADAYLAKGQYKADVLFEKILALLREVPTRPRHGTTDKAPVWVKIDNGIVAVTCTDCLRTFPVLEHISGINTVPCEFCNSTIRFELVTK